jgi:hypothetical protein
MSSRSRTPVPRPVLVVQCLMLVCVALAVAFTATAHAGYYKVVLCAGGNGAGDYATDTNTRSGANPNGIFNLENYCGAPGDPAGDAGFLRIGENQDGGNAGVGAYGQMSWTEPAYIQIKAGGGYTREPGAFNDGWRTRLWGEGDDASQHNILMQGAGVQNGSFGGVGWAKTSTFASHLWPFGGYDTYRRFIFELTCVRPAGCDRSGYNVVDANTFNIVANDASPSSATFYGSPVLSGQWVRGEQNVPWAVADGGAGMRWERIRIDGALRHDIDYGGECNLGWTGTSGEFARGFRPCPVGTFYRSWSLDTASVPDGTHTIQLCAQDYGQSVGLSGTGSESCDARTIRVDNHVPAAPAGLVIKTSNPARYIDHFGASWTLPPDPGSPITKVHYDVVDAAGKVVVAEKTVAATNPVKLDEIAGPPTAGDFRLRVWLEDSVGLTGPMASVPIPRDTTPPAAPQELSVSSPSTSRAAQGFDVRWRNVTDAGAPIDAVHYEVLDPAGGVAVAPRELEGDNPQSIENLDTPRQAGSYTLKLWLSDAEGNVGSPAQVPLSYDCVRSEARGGTSLSLGIGEHLDPALTVSQDQGSIAQGSLHGSSDPVKTAVICLFSRVVTDGGRDFLGVAMTGADGSYRFPVSPGPSREITALNRPDQRQVEAHALIQAQVKPTLRIRKRVVHNKHAAIFQGEIPGPHNNKVVVVLQVKSGKGWRVFRRYRTRDDGHFIARYRFTQTSTPTTYVMRAQVRETTGYPYLQGNSRQIPLRVLP